MLAHARWRCWRRAATTSRREPDAADDLARLLATPACSTSSSTKQSVAAARSDDRHRAALLKGSELARPSASCAPTTWSGTTSVGNYLKGETPPPFDLLYWNSDGTNLPGPDVLLVPAQHLPREQAARAGRDRACGEPVDLGAIDAPAYLYALARGPHRALAGRLSQHARCSAARRRFVLGASRPHRRRDQSAGEEEAQPLDRQGDGAAGDADAWLDTARASTRAAGGPTGPTGSSSHAGKQVAAPKSPGNRKYKAIEPAPGRYVKAKAA